MNPELLQLMQQWEMLQRLAGPMAQGGPPMTPNMQRGANVMQALGPNIGSPMAAEELYMQQRMNNPELLGDIRALQAAPQMTREPQKIGKPGFLESLRISNPDFIIGETLRGANERSQRDLNRERARGGY